MVSSHQKATRLRAVARVRSDPAESKTPCMQTNFIRENRETPSSPTKQHGGPEGERDERQVLHERRWGGVRRHSTGQPAEKSQWIAGGGAGGKPATQGEPAAAQPGPDTEPGKQAKRAGACARSS